MKLYHGTSERAARSALGFSDGGIKPRAALKHKGNWKHTIDSRSDAVYLSVAYAPYFALNAVNLAESGQGAVIEIDSDLLDQQLLVPDEDAIEQTNRSSGELPAKWSMKKRTKYYRDHLHLYDQGQWKDSIQILGNCAYLDTIPLDAITRAAFFDLKDNHRWTIACMDPTISVLNYRIVGDKYRMLTSMLFGDQLPEEPESEKLIKQELQMYHNAWDLAAEFDHSKVELLQFA